MKHNTLHTTYIQSKRAKTQRQTHRKREIICKTVELYLYDRNTFYIYNQTSTDPTGRIDDVDEALLCEKLKFFASL